jgi:hypothetical protein
MVRKASSIRDLWRPSRADHRDAPATPLTPFVLDTFEEQLAKSLEAFDVACSTVLSQLADDLTPSAQGDQPAPPQDMTAADLTALVQLCLDEARNFADQARKERLAQNAFRITPLAEKIDGDAEDKSA